MELKMLSFKVVYSNNTSTNRGLYKNRPNFPVIRGNSILKYLNAR